MFEKLHPWWAWHFLGVFRKKKTRRMCNVVIVYFSKIVDFFRGKKSCVSQNVSFIFHFFFFPLLIPLSVSMLQYHEPFFLCFFYPATWKMFVLKIERKKRKKWKISNLAVKWLFNVMFMISGSHFIFFKDRANRESISIFFLEKKKNSSERTTNETNLEQREWIKNKYKIYVRNKIKKYSNDLWSV